MIVVKHSLLRPESARKEANAMSRITTEGNNSLDIVSIVPGNAQIEKDIVIHEKVVFQNSIVCY